MKTLVLSLLASIALTTSSPASETINFTPDAQTQAELIALIQEWVVAEVSSDQTTLERILHPNFVATWASGKTIDRSAYIDYIINADIPPFEVVNELIRVFDNTAVVIDISGDGKTKFTSILLKTNGQWRVISETFNNVK